MLSAFSARASVLIMLTVHEAKTAARTESADTPTVYIILFQSYYLLESAHAQHLNLFLGEESPVAATQVLLCQSGELYAVELHDMIA